MKRQIAPTRFLPGLFAQSCEKALLTHPDDVLCHPGMTIGQKRAILAAWASDAHAVADSPTLRQLPNGAVVRLDDILDALRSLDQRQQKAFTRHRWRAAPGGPDIARRMRHASVALAASGRSGGDGGDDGRDPPPAAAIAASRRIA